MASGKGGLRAPPELLAEAVLGLDPVIDGGRTRVVPVWISHEASAMAGAVFLPTAPITWRLGTCGAIDSACDFRSRDVTIQRSRGSTSPWIRSSVCASIGRSPRSEGIAWASARESGQNRSPGRPRE